MFSKSCGCHGKDITSTVTALLPNVLSPNRCIKNDKMWTISCEQKQQLERNLRWFISSEVHHKIQSVKWKETQRIADNHGGQHFDDSFCSLGLSKAWPISCLLDSLTKFYANFYIDKYHYWKRDGVCQRKSAQQVYFWIRHPRSLWPNFQTCNTTCWLVDDFHDSQQWECWQKSSQPYQQHDELALVPWNTHAEWMHYGLMTICD